MTIDTTYDAMRIVVKKVNQHQELLPYCADAIDIKVTGAGSLIGPSKRSLVNGSLGFYIRTNNTKGVVTIEVSDGEQKCVEMVVVK
jgi:beta-galactosidase